MKKNIIPFILTVSIIFSLTPVYASEGDPGSVSDASKNPSYLLAGAANDNSLSDEGISNDENLFDSITDNIDETGDLGEDSSTVLDDDTGLTMSDLYAAVSDSMLSNGEESLSECLENMGGINTTFDEVYSLVSLGIDNADVDTGLLNYSYENLSGSLLDNYESVDLSGLSTGCMQLFNDTYGDVLNSINFQSASIPDGFDINSMLNSASSAIASAYGSATNSGTFSDVKSSISIGSIFNEAANGAATVSSLYNSGVSSAASNYDSYRNDSYGYLRNNYKTNANGIQSDYNSYKNSSWAMEQMSQYLESQGDSLFQLDPETGAVSFDYVQLGRDFVLNDVALDAGFQDTLEERMNEKISDWTDWLTSSFNSLYDNLNTFADNHGIDSFDDRSVTDPVFKGWWKSRFGSSDDDE